MSPKHNGWPNRWVLNVCKPLRLLIDAGRQAFYEVVLFFAEILKQDSLTMAMAMPYASALWGRMVAPSDLRGLHHLFSTTFGRQCCHKTIQPSFLCLFPWVHAARLENAAVIRWLWGSGTLHFISTTLNMYQIYQQSQSSVYSLFGFWQRERRTPDRISFLNAAPPEVVDITGSDAWQSSMKFPWNSAANFLDRSMSGERIGLVTKVPRCWHVLANISNVNI